MSPGGGEVGGASNSVIRSHKCIGAYCTRGATSRRWWGGGEGGGGGEVNLNFEATRLYIKLRN